MTKFLLLIVVITLLGAVVTNLYPETDYYKKAKMKKGAIKHAKHRYRSKNYSKRAGCYQKKFRRYKLESKADSSASSSSDRERDGGADKDVVIEMMMDKAAAKSINEYMHEQFVCVDEVFDTKEDQNGKY